MIISYLALLERKTCKFLQMYVINQMYKKKLHADAHEQNPEEQCLGFPAFLKASCGQPCFGQQPAKNKFLVPRLEGR